MAYRNEQDLEPAVETLHQFELCEGITDADLAEIDEWRTLAVTRGNLFALQTHAASLGRTEAGLRVWESAWQAGDRLALEFLGVLYSKGVRPLPDGTPDRVSAYAHKYLNLEIQKAVTATPSQTRRMILAALENDLSREAGKLTPEQWEQAIALAKRLAENPNCCYVP